MNIETVEMNETEQKNVTVEEFISKEQKRLTDAEAGIKLAQTIYSKQMDGKDEEVQKFALSYLSQLLSRNEPRYGW